MRIVICNSKTWFELRPEISAIHDVLNIETKADLSLDILDNFQPELIFFPHWNWLVEKQIFTRFTCIVFHVAPLPYGRGGSPIQNLIKRGFTSSPVCALKMSDGIDDGPIYDKDEISLEGTLSEILDNLNSAVNKLIFQLINHLPTPIKQSGEVKTFKRLGCKDNKISCEANIGEFYNAIRMLDDSSYPSAYLSFKKVNIELSNVKKENGDLICEARILAKER